MPNPEFRKIILVGLGGAGQLILVNLKRLLLDTYGVVPPSVKFLSLDTDAARTELTSRATGNGVSLGPDEYLHLRVADPIGFLAANPEVSNWFIGPAPVGAITNGAGAVRQNGRLAFFYNFRAIRSRLEDAVTALDDVNLPETMENAKSRLKAKCDFKLSEHEPEIYVCGSLAGGTGSGTSIDTGILLRHLRQKQRTVIHGFFLLNWPYRRKPFAHRIQGNVYAALSELDHFQSLMYGDPGHSTYARMYGGQEIKVHAAPFDLVHLVDGRNQAGENIDSVEDLCETVANGIFLSVSSMAYPVKSVVDNLLAHVNVQSRTTWDGRYARYSSLGVASIYYPAPELHEYLSRQSAVGLCDSALQEVDTGSLGETDAAEDAADFLGVSQVTEVGIRSALFRNLQVDPFITDRMNLGNLGVLQGTANQARVDANLLVQSLFALNGPPFRQGLEGLFRDKVAAIRQNPACGAGYLHNWLNAARGTLSKLQSDVATALHAAQTGAQDLGQAADNLFTDQVSKTTWFAGMGGSRKSAVRRWAAAVDAHLAALAEVSVVTLMKTVVDDLLRLVGSESAGEVVGPKQVSSALSEARRILLSRLRDSEKKLEALKGKSNIVLEGQGQVVVYKAGDATECPYDGFKAQKEIHKAEDYLRQPWDLAGLFEGHCREKLAHVLDMTVEEALRTNGAKSGDLSGYLRQRVGHLFRKASPLWRFRHAEVKGLREKHYDQITNLGVCEQEEGAALLEDAALAARARDKILADHTFSTTRDRYHVWLLNYSAVLPAFLLEDQDDRRQVYDNEISPSYHVDRQLELDVPDLFPVDDIYNVALRVLGMAIVGGIDVVKDTKLLKGHEFTLDTAVVRRDNAGQPRVWRLFREMLDEVATSYDQADSSCLLLVLERELESRVTGILAVDDGAEKLRALVKAHQEKLRKKLAIRDFSRLVSARLTHREVRALGDFVDPRRFNLDISKYIHGK